MVSPGSPIVGPGLNPCRKDTAVNIIASRGVVHHERRVSDFVCTITTSTVFFFDHLLYFSPCAVSFDDWADGSGVNTAPGLVVPTKPPSRLTVITVCPPPRAASASQQENIGSFWEDDTGNVSVLGAILDSTVVTRSCVTLRRLLGDSHFFFYEKVDCRPFCFFLRSHVFSTPQATSEILTTSCSWRDERVNTVREERNLQPEFYLREDTDCGENTA